MKDIFKLNKIGKKGKIGYFSYSSMIYIKHPLIK